MDKLRVKAFAVQWSSMVEVNDWAFFLLVQMTKISVHAVSFFHLNNEQDILFCWYKIEDVFREGSQQTGSPVQLHDLEC